MLFLYYVFAIGFCMEERKVVRCVEPILHFVPLTCGLGTAIAALGLQMINPSRSEIFCSIIQNPSYGFKNRVNGDCIRGSTWAATNRVFPLAALSMISFGDVCVEVMSVLIERVVVAGCMMVWDGAVLGAERASFSLSAEWARTHGSGYSVVLCVVVVFVSVGHSVFTSGVEASEVQICMVVDDGYDYCVGY